MIGFQIALLLQRFQRSLNRDEELFDSEERPFHSQYIFGMSFKNENI